MTGEVDTLYEVETAQFADGTVTLFNSAPDVSTALDVQTWLNGNDHSLDLSTLFQDADGDAFTLVVTLADGSPLPAWLSFDGAMGMLSASIPEGLTGLSTIRVNATDVHGNSSWTEFDISVESNVITAPSTGGVLNGTLYSDRMLGSANPDLMFGDNGNDYLSGFGAADTLDGGDGDDSLLGGDGQDSLVGGLGRDYLAGDDGDDRLRAGTGRDTLIGGIGNDRLEGGRGRDRIEGGSGDDRVEGQNGLDNLFGGRGQDRLNGGIGNDRLTGGRDSDTFIFEGSFGNDRIMDFDVDDNNEDIDLSGVAEITDFADLLVEHVDDSTGTVIINDGLGNTITLVGVASIGLLDIGDFSF